MACSTTRVNFITPQYTFNPCEMPAQNTPPRRPRRPRRILSDEYFCGTPGNFISPECENMETGELSPTMQNHIICATCVYPCELVVTDKTVIESVMAVGLMDISFKYAGGKITFAGILDAPDNNAGTRMLFLNVPLILDYGPLGSGYLQFNALYTAMLMPDQCPEITSDMSDLDVFVKTQATLPLTIKSYDLIDNGNGNGNGNGNSNGNGNGNGNSNGSYFRNGASHIALRLDCSELMLKLFFTQTADFDVCLLSSSMPDVSCPMPLMAGMMVNTRNMRMCR